MLLVKYDNIAILHMTNSFNNESLGVLYTITKDNLYTGIGIMSGYPKNISLQGKQYTFIDFLPRVDEDKIIMIIIGLDIPITNNIALSTNFFGDGINVRIKVRGD